MNILCASGGGRYVVINEEGSAPVRWTAGSTNPKSIMHRIPSGTRVPVHAEKTIKHGMIRVVYYEVGEGTERGWISQYTTTGEILIEDARTGKVRREKQPDGAGELAARVRN